MNSISKNHHATTAPPQTHNISTKTNSHHHKPMKSIGKTQHLQ
jgi:hypothetical protein